MKQNVVLGAKIILVQFQYEQHSLGWNLLDEQNVKGFQEPRKLVFDMYNS